LTPLVNLILVEGAFTGHSGGIRALAVSGDGGRIITGGVDQTVRVWDARSGAQLLRLEGHTCALRAVGVFGRLVISCDEDADIRAWDIDSGAEQPLDIRHRSAVLSAAAGPSGRWIALGGEDGDVTCWDLREKTSVRLTLGRSRVRSLAVNADGSVVVAGTNGGGVRVWENGTPRHLGIGTGTVQAVAVHGRDVLAGGGDGAVVAWPHGGEPVRYTGHTGEVTAVAFGSDGDGAYVAAGGNDGRIHVWDRGRPDSPTVLSGHRRRVRGLAAGSGELVSVGDDDAILVWDRRVGVATRGPVIRLADVVNDAESAEDLLGFRGDVRALATVLADRKIEPPLCVALLGAWGSGKSSFLRQLESEIDRLTGVARRNPVRSVFTANVRQIRFNAWHYHDDQLWVGLVEHIFHNLVAEDPAELAARRERLRAQLRDMETLRDNVERHSALRLLRLLVTDADPSVSRRRRIARLLGLSLAALFVVAAAAGLVVGQASVLAAAAAVAAVGAVVMPAVAFAGSVVRPFTAVWERLVGRAEARREELAGNVRDTKELLNQLDAAHRLEERIEQARSARYEQYRGLLGRVHEDLRRLNDDMRALKDEWEKPGARGQPPLERVVLYVDDLDRCSPAKVVDVLAAVHLLLTLPMFVVVVAVDPRWLHRCLSEQGLSLEYLDKIFQLVFTLRPMGDEVRGLIDALLPRQIGDSGTAVAGTSGGSRGGVAATGEPAPVAAPAPKTAAKEKDRRPERLVLRPDELGFVHELAPELGTPRAVKKLVNLYLLVRAGVRDRDLDGFPHREVLLLIAIVVADAPRAAAVFEALTTENADLGELFPPKWRKYRTDDLASYRHWMGTVARFSFETHHLVTPRP
jgi:hypothetical protein